MLKQWEVRKIQVDKGNAIVERVCFRTPLADYTLSPEDWVKVKEKINKV